MSKGTANTFTNQGSGNLPLEGDETDPSRFSNRKENVS